MIIKINHIKFLHQKNIDKLNELFIFSNIQNIINKEIDNFYNSLLLPILKEKAIYNSGDNNILDYDLSDLILNDINLFINEKINQTKQIIDKMKGNNFNIDISIMNVPDFSLIKIEQILSIKKSFNNFIEDHNLEKMEFNKILLETIKNNFKNRVEYFISSFGQDFFNKILKYNEIEKIKGLYDNLKYLLTQTFNYLIKILSLKPSLTLPENLKNKILKLFNLVPFINSMSNKTIEKLNNKLEKNINETKDYIIDRYIYSIKLEPMVQLNFNDDIGVIIEKLLDENKLIFEDEYINMFNIYIKNSFIENYTQIFTQQSNDILSFINENKILIKSKLDTIKVFKTDFILIDIEEKINNTFNSINDYNLYFNSFQIPEETKLLLYNYSKKNILPHYEEIKNILDEYTKDIVIQNLDININNFKKDYSLNNFEITSNNISSYLKNTYFNIINKYLKSYGAIDYVYLINLDKEIAKYESINDKSIYNKNINLKLEDLFLLLKNLSDIQSIKDSISIDNFEEKINKYINTINAQYETTKINIKNMNYEEKENQKLNKNLDILKNYTMEYYIKANSSYYKIKQSIENSINQLKELIEKCEIITYEEINNKYTQIKNNYNSISYVKKITKEKTIELDKYIETI